jgi:hypothetical protein
MVFETFMAASLSRPSPALSRWFNNHQTDEC